jgi:hypothetical protein
MRCVRLATFLTVVVCAFAGCSSTSSSGGDAPQTVTVEDVTSDDGADAQASLQDQGFDVTPTSEDSTFDPGRDLTGCPVTDQDPSGGAEAGYGAEVTLSVDCSQVDWENQEGDAWETFAQDYSDGFTTGCENLFDQSPSGSLYEDNYEYTVSDCENEEGDASDGSDVPSAVPGDPQQAGQDLGELDGCQSLFENQSVTSFNYGTDSYTESDCPIDASTSVPPSRPRPKTTTKRAGDTCIAKKADGSPITLQIEKGTANCGGAQALTQDWLRRAPKEGSGSGGALTLNGWSCVGATATEAPRVGSCERTDKAARFTIYDGE